MLITPLQTHNTLADPRRRGARDARPHLWSNIFNFMRFLGNNCQNNRLIPVADPGFPRRGAPTPRGRGCQRIIWPNFAENCMKMKKIGRGRPKFYCRNPSLDTPPLGLASPSGKSWTRHCNILRTLMQLWQYFEVK